MIAWSRRDCLKYLTMRNAHKSTGSASFASTWMQASVLLTASISSRDACGKSRDKLIERANVAHCSGGVAEAVQLRRRYAVMKEAARARRR